jgi:hypothetical protein
MVFREDPPGVCDLIPMTGNRLTSSMRQPFVPAASRKLEILLVLLLVSGYAALLAWFKYADVYHTHFFSTGFLPLLNTAFHVLFIFYLFCIVQTVGAAFLRLFGECHPETIGTLDYLALTFFVGTGPWHVVLMTIGYLSLLNAAMMVILTVPVVALSLRELRLVAPGVRTLFRERFGQGSSSLKAAGLLLTFVWCALLVIKGLDPGAGGSDYFLHYFPAYQAFLDHGSLWPNEVWWHYYYSKGAGLYFLAMLLTDPLAPQLVTFCFMSIAGLSIFLFVRRLASRTAWPIVSILLFFGLYVYTPGWGEFGKLHEFNTSFVIALLWITLVAFDDTTSNGRVWLAAAASAMTAAVIINPVIGVFLIPLFTVLTLSYALLRDRRRALVCLAFAVAGGALLSGILFINYVTTGLLNDLALGHAWTFANVEKLYQWGALPRAIWRYYPLAGPLDVRLEKSLNLLNSALRLSLLWPLIFGGLLVASISAYERYRAGDFGKRSDVALVLIAAFVVFAALSVTEGRRLPFSFYRFSSFMVPVVIVAGIAMWAAPLRHQSRLSLSAIFKNPVVPVMVLALCAVVLAAKTRIDRHIVQLGMGALKYAAGLRSAEDAYVHQSNGHPVGPWGGIHPGSRGAYAIVGPHIAIWSLHNQSYCMLPDCKVMYYQPFLMGRSWDRVIWGTPEEAQTALRVAGLNYFLFSRDLQIRDPLPLSPLFSPDNIARHLAIRWTDGTSTLLTWSGAQTMPLDAAWLAEYRQAVDRSPLVRRFPAAAMKAIFERLNATPHPWRSVELPWLIQ